MFISVMSNTDVLAEIQRRRLDKNMYEDYLEIQKLWLNNEVLRYQKAKDFPCSIMDFGAEEIEFYTLNYPKTINMDWEIETALQTELAQVRECMPTRILFLDASREVLLRNKENDPTRSRNFFEHHLNYLLPLKRKWFIGRENVDVLNVDELTVEEVGRKVKHWVDHCMEHYK